jgi:dCTP deaminase
MLLSDREIREAVKNGDINIDPFNDTQVQPNSYDFRLGGWIVRQKEISGLGMYYPYEDPSIWNDPIRPEDGIFAIRPGEMILAHSQEVMGGLNNITTEMKTRSSMARIGISVCRCAGVGDVGYNNIWTMEITNHSKWLIALPVGCRIGQMLFVRTGPTDKPYSGSYLQKPEWSPFDMLPKFNPNKL